jgi:hypothetical protein
MDLRRAAEATSLPSAFHRLNAIQSPRLYALPCESSSRGRDFLIISRAKGKSAAGLSSGTAGTRSSNRRAFPKTSRNPTASPEFEKSGEQPLTEFSIRIGYHLVKVPGSRWLEP